MAKLDEKKLVYEYHKHAATIGIHKDGLVEISMGEKHCIQLTKSQVDEIIASRRLFMSGV